MTRPGRPQKDRIGKQAQELTVEEAVERFNLPRLQQYLDGDRDRSAGWKDEYKHQHCAEGGRHD